MKRCRLKVSIIEVISKKNVMALVTIVQRSPLGLGHYRSRSPLGIARRTFFSRKTYPNASDHNARNFRKLINYGKTYQLDKILALKMESNRVTRHKTFETCFFNRELIFFAVFDVYSSAKALL